MGYGAYAKLPPPGRTMAKALGLDCIYTFLFSGISSGKYRDTPSHRRRSILHLDGERTVQEVAVIFCLA